MGDVRDAATMTAKMIGGGRNVIEDRGRGRGRGRQTGIGTGRGATGNINSPRGLGLARAREARKGKEVRIGGVMTTNTMRDAEAKSTEREIMSKTTGGGEVEAQVDRVHDHRLKEEDGEVDEVDEVDNDIMISESKVENDV